jgi:hypothetical protein
MDLEETVARIHGGFDAEAAMRDLAEVARHDRYQGSAGLAAAATRVAEAAAGAGLRDVELLRFPADGRVRWWNFQAPAAWTPLRARLSLAGADGRPSRTVLDYPEQPYGLAAFSAATPPGGIVTPLLAASALGDAARCPGAVVLLDEPGVPPPPALAWAERAGAAGVVASTGRGSGAPERVGRVELRAGARMFAFSVGAAGMEELLAASRAGGRAHVEVELDPDHGGGGGMAAVSARLEGETAGEALLTAHLCHPRPSANDNASGVAALLGVGRVLAAGDGRPRVGVRFLWAPEFVGLAAWLHRRAGGSGPARSGSRPLFGVNLDMAGEDQRRCGGPLIVERSPDHLPGCLNAVAERCAALLPHAASSYSGAVPLDGWAWRATPFVGASDHGLLVDRSVGCPAISLGHWPDRFNHSADDTIDKVDPAELRRTGTVAGATVAAIAAAGPGDAGELERLVVGWGAGQMLDCLATRRHGATAGAAWIDPLDPRLARERLHHRREVALRSVMALGEVVPGWSEPRAQAAARWIRDLAGHLERRLPAPEAGAAPDATRLDRAWPGPFNLRGLAAAAGAEDRAWLAARLAEGGGGAYARLVAIAHALDGGAGRRTVLRRAAFASGLPLETGAGERFLDLMVAAGWAVERPGS